MINEIEFKPISKLSECYSLKAIADRYGLSIDNFKLEIERVRLLKKSMIDTRLKKGYTLEQAENETLRCLYISGFSGPTFN